ncbi:MAG TPA: amino acid adenylation domain-containing protein [Mycobacteriales bacterium]|nr:amino acid adenylation domain-containing protein [Mycobacteriales bacterium]
MNVRDSLVPHVRPVGAQRYAWFAQACSGRATVNDPVVLRLTGRLDVLALRAALAAVYARHPVLGTSFLVREDVLVLGRGGRVEPEFRVVDVASAAEAVSLAAEPATWPDRRSGPFVRLRLLRVSGVEHVLVLDTHRLVCDGPSVAVLLRELAEVYSAAVAGRPPDLPEPPVRYADYARWQQAWLSGPAVQSELAGWQRELAGLAPLDLPTDRPRPTAPSGHAGLVRRRVAGPSAPPRARLDTELVAALALVLARYTGGGDVALGVRLGSPVAELAGSVGPFEEPAVLRLDTSGDPDLASLVTRAATALDTAARHATVPFAALAERADTSGWAGRHPVFQVELAVREQIAVRLAGLEVEPFAPSGDATLGAGLNSELDLGLDLAVTAVRGVDGLDLRVRYATDLFDRWRAERMADHMVLALDAVRADQGRRMWQVGLLPAAERDQVLSGWHGPDRRYPAAPVHAQVAAQAARTPEATAVVDPSEAVSYRELDLRSNRLANHLRSLGVRTGVLVGVFLPRGVELVTTLLAVLKAGGAYVPLDLGYPAGRIAMILADAGARLVVTRSDLSDRLPDTGSATVVPLDTDRARIAAADGAPLPDGWDPDRLCHVVFTSGSTGRPKGVAACHRNVTAYLSGLLATVEADRFARVLFSTAVSFDACLVELWPPLLVGGTLVVVDNLLLVSDQVGHHDDVTLVNTVPSVLTEYLRLGTLPRGLRTLTVGAEPLPPGLVERVFAESSVREIYNMYGPTETTAYATMCRLTRSDTAVTIGRPLPNVRTYVLDRAGSPAPVGVPGELHLGGPGVASGYVGRAGLTAERFVPDHLTPVPGSRLYRTGDLARWTPTGQIEFVGRIDTQVKLRGFRIELGEIEATLARHPRVAAAVAAVRPDPAGEPQLVGYVVRSGDPAAGDPASPVDPVDLAAFCRGTLPPYMEPAAFGVIDAVPLSPTGKVNRGALPEPGWPNRRAGAARRPAGEPDQVERELRALAAGPPGDDLAGGGRWSAALRLSHRARSRFGVGPGVWQVYQAPDVVALAGAVRDDAPRGGADSVDGSGAAATRQPREEDYGVG